MANAADTPTIDDRPPTRLGRYEVAGRVGEGGMAAVYLGHATGAAGFQRDVAIKLCHPHLANDPAFRTMFLDEARLAARVQHPNVVSTIDVGDEERLYIVMEYIEGGSANELLQQCVKTGARIPTPVVLRMAADALSGLHAAHEAKDRRGRPLNLIHRDISPQNLLVGIDGVTRVADFGIAKSEARATITSANQLKGKLSYMAPEQLHQGVVSRRTDLFAAATVLWELLTRKRLFMSSEGRADVIQKILFAPMRTPSSVNPALPAELDAVVMKGLERDPTHRYETARAFVEALEARGELATHREVGDFVSSTLADLIAERRAVLLGQSAGVTRTIADKVAGESHVRSTKIIRPDRGSLLWVAAIALATVVGVLGAYVVTTSLLDSGEEDGGELEASAPPETAVPPAPVADPEPVVPVAAPAEPPVIDAEPVEAPPEAEGESTVRQSSRSRPGARRRNMRRRAMAMSGGEFRPDGL